MVMEAEYRREMNRNYMVLSPESGRIDKYTIRMISGNHIPGLLPFQEKWIDGKNQYYYDVTSKQPIGRILEYRNMKGEELKIFLSSLIFSIRQMERFLLDESQICLEPDYIYTEPETFQCALVLIPGNYGDFVQSFRSLSQYLLDHVSQNDKDAVVLAFSVFKESRKMNFGMDDIENCLGILSCEKENPAPPPAAVCEEVTEEMEIPPTKKEVFREEEEQKNETSFLWIFPAGLMVLIPLVIFGVAGIRGLNRWKWYLCGIELVLSYIAFNIREKINKSEKHEDSDNETEKEVSWETYLQDQGNYEGESTFEEDKDSSEKMQTILLTSNSHLAGNRMLVPITGGKEIEIPYFPFLIGKSEGIADFCLDRSGVSRLHVKIEEKEGGYQVTDLNSTNGTKVDGRLLNANETCPLQIGSELAIAAERFIFR